MPMGIVSDDDFLRELERTRVKNVEIIEEDKPGRKEGDNNVPSALRKIIGETSELEGRQEALSLAYSFGISPSSVSAYAKGSTSTKTYNKPKASIAGYIQGRKNQITKKALRTLQNSLDSIPTDLSSEKPRNIAAIAKDMSAIVKNLEPEQGGVNNQQNNQFIFYRPEMMKEEDYPTIVVRE